MLQITHEYAQINSQYSIIRSIRIHLNRCKFAQSIRVNGSLTN